MKLYFHAEAWKAKKKNCSTSSHPLVSVCLGSSLAPLLVELLHYNVMCAEAAQ